jgi:hypothetical protein
LANCPGSISAVDLLISAADLRSRAVGLLISAGRLGKHCYGLTNQLAY